MSILRVRNKTTNQWEEIQAIKGEQGPKGDTGEQGIQGEKGDTGAAGADAKINGVNTLTVEAGENISISQSGSTMTISSTGGGTTDYSNLSNKPKINSVELNGNKSLSDLGVQETLVSGTNIKTINNNSILGSGNITIQSGGGTSDYSDLTNKPQINSVTLSGNKSLSDLGIQPSGSYLTSESDPIFTASAAYGISSNDISSWNAKADTSDIPDVSNFITKSVDDLTYYYTKTEVDSKVSSVYKYEGTVSTYSNLPSSGLTAGDVYNVEQADSTHGIKAGDNVAWTGSAWDKLGGDVDLSGYQTKIDSSHKLSADLVDDTSTTNKFVTASDKTNWNGKYSKPSGGIPSTDLSNAVQTSLGKADTAIQDISGKQDALVSGTNIKTINNTSILGSGNISLPQVTDSYSASTSDSYSCNYVNGLNTFSTTEQRIGTWTNGKPIYRKVITGTKVSGTELAITVDNNLDEIVMTYGGRLIRTDLNRGYAIPMYESSNVYVRVELRQDTKQIAIVSSAGQYSNGNVSIVVCYTKTTD